MIYEAVLFDMDGVIIDTRQSVTDFWQNLATVHDVRLTQADFDRHIYGCPATHTLDLLFTQLNTQERQAVLAKIATYETSLTYAEVPGAVALLRFLKHHHIPTALVTSGEQWKVSEVIRQLNLSGLFTVQVTAGDIKQGKPHPECYLLAAHFLQKSPASCIVFEDAISGVKAAVAAEALCIGVQSSNMASALLQAGARYVVPDFMSVELLVSSAGENDIGKLLCLQISAEQSLRLNASQQSFVS